MNDFIKNKQKNTFNTKKPARKRWSFWLACCVMAFWTVGSIVGIVGFARGFSDGKNIAYADEVETNFIFNGSNIQFYTRSSPDLNDQNYYRMYGFSFRPYIVFAPNGFYLNLLDSPFTSGSSTVYPSRLSAFLNIMLGSVANNNFSCVVESDYNSVVFNMINGNSILNYGQTYNFTDDNSYLYLRDYFHLGTSQNNLDSRLRVSWSMQVFNDSDFSYYTVNLGSNGVLLYQFYNSSDNLIMVFTFNFLGSSIASFSQMGTYSRTFIIANSSSTDYQSGYSQGYEYGYSAGQSSGYTSGYSAGQSSGYASGYHVGYGAGVADSNQYTFMNLMGAVVDAPIKAFRGLFSFEVFGIDMSSFLLSLFSFCVIITVIKIFI